MTMEEYEKRFLVLLSYVEFIQEEKFKIQQFLSVLQVFYKDWITYDEPHTLKECIRKSKCLYEQVKNRQDVCKVWKGKLKEKSYQRKNGIKPLDVK